MVRFTDNVRPKYLRGLTATVEKIGSRVSVKVDDQYAARRFGSGPVRCPSTILERVVKA